MLGVKRPLIDGKIDEIELTVQESELFQREAAQEEAVEEELVVEEISIDGMCGVY
jgi:mycofactocin precursor